MYKIVFSDADGTLLNSQRVITPKTERAIKSLQSKGIPFVIVSARSPLGIKTIMRAHDLTCPLIAFSGGLIMDEQGNVLYHKGIRKSKAADIVSFVESTGIDCVWSVYSLNQWIVQNDLDPRIIREQSHVLVQPIKGSVDMIVDDQINKILCICNAEDTERLELAVKEKFPDCYVAKSSDRLLEIMHGSVSKATAVEKLCGVMGLSTNDAVAYGDNYNDAEMLRSVGMGVLMGNAPQPLQQQIPNHTQDNNSDGVYHSLLRLGLVESQE